MTTPRTASALITEDISSWPGVEAGWGRRGEFAFTVGRREIGHLHGDHVAHFGFPKQVWAVLHDVIELLRLNCDRVVGRFGVPAEAA